jgi:hypothetical protein
MTAVAVMRAATGNLLVQAKVFVTKNWKFLRVILLVSLIYGLLFGFLFKYLPVAEYLTQLQKYSQANAASVSICLFIYMVVGELLFLRDSFLSPSHPNLFTLTMILSTFVLVIDTTCVT